MYGARCASRGAGSIPARGSGVGRVEIVLALVSVSATATLFVALGEVLKQGLIVALGFDFPLMSPEQVVEDVLHAIVGALKHHFLNLFSLFVLQGRTRAWR